jgi:hypothetical protein
MEPLLTNPSFTQRPATTFNEFLNSIGASHLSVKSVTTQMDNGKKGVSHQTPTYEYVDHVLSPDLTVDELEVPAHNGSFASINPNNSFDQVDPVQSTFPTETGGLSTQISKPFQNFSGQEFISLTTKGAITTLPEKNGSTKISNCIESSCFQGVSCVSTTGGHFKCGRCPFGYYGDGITCRGTVRIFHHT